tara:strand:- start:796 stop:1203 length:408 start_codon:yes stop_codon:yes gene_type:complete
MVKVYSGLEFQKQQLRLETSLQYFNNLKRGSEFPFLPSIGITDIFQAFDASEPHRFLGVLHLKFVDGEWKKEWLDEPQDGVESILQVRKSKFYDTDKLVGIVINRVQKYAKKEAMKVLKERIDEHDDDDGGPILN